MTHQSQLKATTAGVWGGADLAKSWTFSEPLLDKPSTIWTNSPINLLL